MQDPSPALSEREPAGPLDPIDDRALSRHVRTIFRIWIFVIGVVGAQMGWVLRPFVGNPMAPVQFFREESWSNAYVVVIEMLWNAATGR